MDFEKAKVISFINLKGGVGKTSTAINIADAISRTGQQVLVIDMDPQFNATQALLNHQYRYHRKEIEPVMLAEAQKELNENYDEVVNTSLIQEEDKELEEVQDGELNLDEHYKKEISSQLLYNRLKARGITVRTLFTYEGVVDTLENPSLVYKVKNNLDLIPGNLDLFESLSGDTSGKHNVLEDHIESYSLRKLYDYIIIDCPPNWTILTQASLFASDYYIIPSKIDLFSSVGIGLLESLVSSTFYDKKSSINKLYNIYRREIGRQRIECLGVLFTLTHDLTIAEKLKERLQREISQAVFESEIPYHPSVPLKFSLYDESGAKHDTLKNSIIRVVSEIKERISNRNFVKEEVHENRG
ncbi:AAA family ATPase [Schinkia azotoformans]|uniref:AAA family ATPase n=1 Tax=Schinkia azotoformans TaxID=1454 RepID=UPI002E1C70D6|nr:AAA family ATPase [Schinkia azotoformans]